MTDLRAVVLAGALAAFVAGALGSLFWQPLWRALSALRAGSSAERPAATLWRTLTVQLHLAILIVHVCAGALLGFLFWLSWGLTGLVGVSWWLRGLSFAGITWLALCAPLLISQLLTARTHWTLICKIAMEWLTACTLVGLACAWSWTKGP